MAAVVRPPFRALVSEHFTLEELTRTSQPHPNVPADKHVVCLRALCLAVLEPWRATVGALYVNSGYRSPAVNRAVGGDPDSQHVKGEAADIVPLGRGRASKSPSPAERARALEKGWESLVHLTGEGLPVDQAIVYVRAPGRGWVHVSHTTRRPPRRELLVHVPEQGYVSWQGYRGPLVLPG